MEERPANTLEHFKWWASLLTLDNQRRWELEEFQCEIVAEVFARYREVVAILPTGSYKTTTFGGLGLYHMQYTPGAKVPVGASSKQQAGILYEQAAGFVIRSKGLQKRFKVQDGYRRIVGMKGTPYEGRWMRVFSASDDTGDGIIPTLPLIDELHRHKGHDLYGTWRDKLTKSDGTMVTLSTAGDSDDNPLEQLREAARKMPNVVTVGRHTVARSKGREFVMHEYALRPGDDTEDLEVVKLANPASQVTIEELRMRRDSPSTKPWQWKRFTCNLRAKGEDSTIQPEEWDARSHDGAVWDTEASTWLGMDLGWKIDHAAIIPVTWVSAFKRLIYGARTYAPPVEEWVLVARLLHLHELLKVEGVVYDPNAGGEQMVQQLEAGTHPLQTSDDARMTVGLSPLAESHVEAMSFVEHSQDNTPMSLATSRFDEAFRHGWIWHDGANTCETKGCRCGGLRGHVTNAVTHTLTGEKWKYDRPKDARGGKRAKFPIDALTGAVMSHSVAVAEEGEGGGRMNVADYRIETV